MSQTKTTSIKMLNIQHYYIQKPLLLWKCIKHEPTLHGTMSMSILSLLQRIKSINWSSEHVAGNIVHLYIRKNNFILYFHVLPSISLCHFNGFTLFYSQFMFHVRFWFNINFIDFSTKFWLIFINSSIYSLKIYLNA